MKVKLKNLLSDVEASMDSIKYSYSNDKVPARIIGYILELQDRIASEHIEVVNDKGTDVTKPFLLKLDDMMKNNLDRTTLYELVEAPDLDFIEEEEGYSKCPKTLNSNSTKFRIIRSSDKIEVGRCVIMVIDDKSIEVQFIELKERFNQKLSMMDIIADCSLVEYGPVKFTFSDDFTGIPVKR